MVEVVRAARTEPLNIVDRKVLADIASYGVPVLMLMLCIVSLNLTMERAGFLRTWTDSYGATATFLVVGCESVDRLNGDQWSCEGRLEAATTSGSSTLTTSQDALGSSRPYVGERLEVFHAVGDQATVYPLQYRLNELARLYLSLLPRLLLLLGSTIWLAGWLSTRNIDPADAVALDEIRLPQRFIWRSRGVSWILAGVGVLVLNHILTTRLLGSLAIL